MSSINSSIQNKYLRVFDSLIMFDLAAIVFFKSLRSTHETIIKFVHISENVHTQICGQFASGQWMDGFIYDLAFSLLWEHFQNLLHQFVSHASTFDVL